jgi:hypothetical protein
MAWNEGVIMNDEMEMMRVDVIVVLYGCETWSLIIREEHRLRVFKNRVLRKIFGPKRDDVTGEWRKLHNEKLHILYSFPDIIRQMKSRRGEECVRFWWENPKERDHLEDQDIDGRMGLEWILGRLAGV